MYGIEYPKHKKVIFLFDIEIINKYCKNYNIKVLYYSN